MIFIIGGSYQGKEAFAAERWSLSSEEIFRCDDCGAIELDRRCITHIERFALDCVRRGADAEAFWRAHAGQLRDTIVISDDISCGVVPIDPVMRAWREANGRANNTLAGMASAVYRVFCGLGVRIK